MLTFEPLTESDLLDFHALHADPHVWEHFPSGRHANMEKSRAALADQVVDWESAGLGYWAVRDEYRRLLAVGGARLAHDGAVWNLYWRVARDSWGRGIATSIAARAASETARIDSGIPVVAVLLEHNAASLHTARKFLSVVWRGPDAGNPDPDAVRLILADRPLTDSLIERISAA